LTSDICVVHLVWAPLGPEPLRRFLDSYTRYSAGVEHRLLILFNGFRADHDLSPWQRALDHVRHEELRIPSPVLDLAAYRQAVERITAARYCFLNSYSVIREDGWLELMSSIASGHRVGAVGASGSWGSQFSHARYALGLGGPYRRVFADRQATHRVFAGLSADTPAATSPAGPLRRALAGARGVIAYSVAFPPFPSPHLRSNCLLIDRDLWLRVADPAPHDKLAAYRVESGRRGITARLRAMGLRVLVAGRDGHSYDTAEWPASRTFWQGSQENLLVEDNQTRAYQQGDSEVRRVLSGYAWGPQADPAEAWVSEAA
jgi:hypothetical protein